MRSRERFNAKAKLLLALVAATATFLALASTALAAPEWELHSVSNPTAAPGSTVDYIIVLRNEGDAKAPEVAEGDADNCTPGAPPPSVAASCYTLTAQFPEGLALVEIKNLGGWSSCTILGGDNQVVCQATGHTELEQVVPFGSRTVTIAVEVAADGGGKMLTTAVEASGAGAGTDSTVDPLLVTAALPEFGIAAFDAHLSADAAGHLSTQAGGHPYEYSTQIEYNSVNESSLFEGERPLFPVGSARTIVAELPAGLVGNPTIAEQCTLTQLGNMGGSIESKSLCPSTSQVGTTLVRSPAGSSPLFGPLPLYNMEPPSGSPARFGFNLLGTVVTLDASLRYESDYGITVTGHVPQALAVQASEVTVWGVPSDEVHTNQRACPGEKAPWDSGPTCTSGASPKPFWRNPTSCPANSDEGMVTDLYVDSWEEPGEFVHTSVESHDPPTFPAAPGERGGIHGVEGCEEVPVKGSLEAQPTSIDTETSSGLEVHVEVPNTGIENPTGIASSDLKRVQVTLPRGMTINPSQAEGLGACSSAQYESTVLSFFPTPGKGCPDDAKIGTVEVKTPLLEETIPGNVFVAKPFDNPFNSLLALYIVLAEPERGILATLPGELRTNEQTGRLEAEFDDLPQTPFSTFDFKFREGARAPLVTPPTCGTYETVTEIEGHSDPGNPIVSKSSFEIARGIGGGPCPTGGTPGFKPGFSAGSINPMAGAFSAFTMRLTRQDGEQDMTRFSAVLPPGVLGKLAGISKCPNSAVAIAKSKSGVQEQASPSCPANSQIGRSLVGAGVGSVLTYVPGKIYLGGPFNGRPLSVIAITPAVAGPFDVGTVVVQEALTLNPKTAEVEVDGSASDPIPHMLKGIPAKLRDLRVYVDRPEFIINPTSCDESATDATLFGGGGNAFSTTDDVPVFLQDRFQAANCAALGFKPKLGLKLKGGTKRGDFPGLQATYRPRPGDANLEGLVVRLPRSAFLEQGHIRTICTRVQFAADACPKGSQYGYIKAWTPLLDEPLQGPVWLRSSNHKLPDLVFDLHGLVDIEVATRIDSVRGGVRASVASIPDAPLSKVVLRMQGGKKGLIVNSRNLCTSKNKANVESDGHNGKVSDFNPAMRPECGGKKRKR